MDAYRRAHDDHKPNEVPRLERRAFAIVVVPHDDRLDYVVAAVHTHLRDRTEFASDLVLDLPHLAVLRVDSADQAVLQDVLEMAPVLERRAMVH